MRILVGGMNHESNSLNPIITGEDDFLVYWGKEITLNGMHPNYASTGIINTLQAQGAEVVPVGLCRAVPNGVVSSSFYNMFKTAFMDRAREIAMTCKIDGICLALHGSMKVEDLGCAEGDFCSDLRSIFPDLPFTAALDMHATITTKLLLAVDGFAGYKTAPHEDCAETGARAASMLLNAIRGNLHLHSVYQKIPMMVAGEKSESSIEPMVSLIKACNEAEKQPGIEAASLLLGFPWADDEHNAASIVVSFTGEARDAAHRDAAYRDTAHKNAAHKNAAYKIAKDLAQSFWNRRKDFSFRTEHYETKEALSAAFSYAERGEKPVFLSDSGDNPTAGATGDSTDLLEEILKSIDRVDKLPTPFLYSGFFDKAVTEACIKAGEGSVINISLGGKKDTANGNEIPLNVEVKKVSRNFGHYKTDLALLLHRNLLIVVTSKHIGFGDNDLLCALGINAEDFCIVAVKLGYLEPCFRDIAARSILALTKGCSNEVLEAIPYKNVLRPIYPLDHDMEWTT